LEKSKEKNPHAEIIYTDIPATFPSASCLYYHNLWEAKSLFGGSQEGGVLCGVWLVTEDKIL
jgi:hypothetical protein